MASFFSDPRIYLLLFVGVFSFVMAIRVHVKTKVTLPIRYYSLFAISIGFWVLGRTFFSVTKDSFTAQIFSYFFFMAPIFFILFLLLFSLSLERKHTRFTLFTKLIIFVPWGALLVLTLIFPFSIREATIAGPPYFDLVYNKYFVYFYAPIISTYLLVLFPILTRIYFRSEGEQKLRLRYIIVSLFFSIVVGITTNIIFPITGLTSYVWVGPASTIIAVATVGYALLRKDLWDFKLVISEFLVFSIILILLFDIFLNTTESSYFIFKFITLSLVVIFSYFLINGISNEFESRERIKHFTNEFSIANKRLQEIDIEKSEFVSIASHQLRTPLTIVKGYTSMLLEGTFGIIEYEEQRSIIQKIYDASERLVKMIDDFLDISRIEAGEMSYTFEKIDIKKLVQEVISEFKATSEGSKILITIKSTHVPLYIDGDTLKIRQVITNLLDNAIKYSYKNNQITITVKESSGKALLSFEDSGIGIPAEKRSDLFKKYSRVVPYEKLHREGRGLGLYIARQIMVAHRGTIWVESEGTGRGSIFYISFPLFQEGMGGERVELRPLVKDIKQPSPV